jgi:hypothetical protein
VKTFVSAANKASMIVLSRAENREVHPSELPSLSHLPQSRPFFGAFNCFWKTVRPVPVPQPHSHMLRSDLSRVTSPSASSLDDDECSFLSFSKREYLLAQLRQKDELIDSLLKQVCLEHSLGKCERSQSVSHFLATQSISSQPSLNRTIPQCNVFE